MIDSYSLDLDVNFEAALIRGKVTIHSVNIEDPFELDAKEMEIRNVSIDGESFPFEYIKEYDVVRIAGLPRDRRDVQVSLEYEKQISDKASTGVYKSRYSQHYFIVTDFEPDRAKTFFPCKDNPAAKAIFNVSVTTRKDLKVISNSAIEAVEDLPDGKRRKFVFSPSPKMSTYLLFVGIGNFAEKAVAVPNSNKKVILAGRPEVADKFDFSLDIASSVLAESEKYFGVPYPLDKLHIVALSEYNGAMENWGAITSAEMMVILDKKSSTIFDLRAGAITTAHEIQHQWFGDLVTMKWWNDIWLNEGFATVMAYKIIDRLHPDWHMWSEFLLRWGFVASRIDALRATHPIEMKMNRPSEMNEVFDSISYGKGASVLKMIEGFLGADAFRQGISNYIKKFSYSNATSEDLWNALEQASGQPVSRIMDYWVRRPGYPLVTVENRGDRLVFYQQRFFLTDGGKDTDRQFWPIPISLQINGETERFLFTEELRHFEIPGGSLKQLKVNIGQTGFYCVRYDDSIYAMLEKQFATLDELDKAGIMNDLFHLLMSGEIEPKLYFRFVSICTYEEDYTVVRTVCQQLQLLNGIAEQSKDVQTVSRSFLKSQMERLGIFAKQEEDPSQGILREFVSLQLASMDSEFAARMANEFDKYDSLDPEVRSATAIGYVRTCGEGAYEILIEMIKKAASEVDREKLYAGLVHLEDPSLVEKVIDFSASGQVPRTDVFWTLTGSSYNPLQRNVAWKWIKKNFDTLWDLIGSTLFVLTLLQYAIPRCALEDEDGAKLFLSGDRMRRGKISFEQDLELLHVYGNLRKRLSS